MKIQIQKADNGFIVDDISEDINNICSRIVIELDEDLDDKKGETKLLYQIAELLGIYSYDGFSDKNLNITWDKKGDEL